jgi:hypothetical protein
MNVLYTLVKKQLGNPRLKPSSVVCEAARIFRERARRLPRACLKQYAGNTIERQVVLAEPAARWSNLPFAVSCGGLDEEPLVSCWLEPHQLHPGQEVAVHLVVG